MDEMSANNQYQSDLSDNTVNWAKLVGIGVKEVEFEIRAK